MPGCLTAAVTVGASDRFRRGVALIATIRCRFPDLRNRLNRRPYRTLLAPFVRALADSGDCV